jgi:hypothetical protein
VWHKSALQGLTVLVTTLLVASHTRAALAQSQGWAPVIEQPGSPQRTGSTPAPPPNSWRPATSGQKQPQPRWTGAVRDHPSFSGSQAPQSPRWAAQLQPKTKNPKARWTPQPAASSSGRASASFPRWEPLSTGKEQANRVVWRLVSPNEPELVPMDPAIAKAQIPLPPVPALQALNRSIAFDDRTPGPDLAWKVPQGFRWSEQWFLDFSVAGANTRPPNSKFWAWNNGDAVADLHVRVFQQQNWSFGINATFRSVYQGTNAAGGTTAIGDGFASGFRLDYALSKTAGLAIGAEQLIQYDSNNDSGRNLYLVGSNGWWLGGRAGQFPLLVTTAGIGTGRLGDNPSLQFACASGVAGITDVSSNTSSPLCWSPIGSAALVFNSAFSVFSEYNSQDWLAGLSFNANNDFPLRLTWGVLLGNKGTNYTYVGNENLRWFFRASISL